MKKFVIVICLVFSFTQTAEASRSLSIEADKDSLFGEEELLITASPSGFTQGESIYIKGAFYREGSTNYFGYTKKDDLWVRNSTSTTEQRSVKIGDWDGTITLKADFLDSGYQGEDTYYLKIGYYYSNSSGTLSSVNWSSNSLLININQADFTPSASPVLLVASPRAGPTPKPVSLTPTIIKEVAGSKSAHFGKIASDFKISSQYASLRNKLNKAKKNEVRVLGAKNNSFSFATITTGFLLIWLGLGTFLFRYLRGKDII